MVFLEILRMEAGIAPSCSAPPPDDSGEGFFVAAGKIDRP